jgi:hypothetical protein
MRYACILLLAISVFFARPALAANHGAPDPVAPSSGIHAPVPPAFENNKGRAIIVIADRTSIDDWTETDLPNLHRLTDKYAIGLMNCRTGGNDIPDNTFLTIGAGVPLKAPGTTDSAYHAQEKMQSDQVQHIYRQRTGITPPPNSIVQTEIARMYRLNEGNPYTLGPGTLGMMLERENIKTAVLGNSDSINGLRRPAVSLAMNENGIVQTGIIDDRTLIEDINFPGGYRSSYEVILAGFKSLPRDIRLVVIDLGDLSRIEDAEYMVFNSLIPELRSQSMRRIDNFLGQLVQNMDLEQDFLAVISPTPRGGTVRGANLLTPVMLAGSGINEGLIYSPTTKRPGIIRNTDLLPTILAYMGIESPVGTTGQVLQVMPGDYSLSSLASLQKELVLTYDWRRPVLRTYVLIQLLLLGTSLLFIFWKKPSALSILKFIILAVMSFPVATLMLPLFPRPSPGVLISLLLGIVLILVLIAVRLNRFGSLTPFIFISGLTSILILADLLMGGPLQKSSLLGYDPIMGARFYGLGNEYMGILIGSTLLATTSLLTQCSKQKRPLMAVACLYFLFAAYVIAAPHLGTNVGGTISSVGAFLVTSLLLFGVNINRRVILVISSGIVAVVLGFIIFDVSRPAAMQSHIGRTASLILSGGVSEIINIISRKLAMNIKLIRYTIWSRIFLASLGCLALLFYRPSGVMELIRQKHPLLYKGLTGVLVGSILAFIFNDSGVVAAATAMIFAVYPMVYLIFEQISIKEG